MIPKFCLDRTNKMIPKDGSSSTVRGIGWALAGRTLRRSGMPLFVGVTIAEITIRPSWMWFSYANLVRSLSRDNSRTPQFSDKTLQFSDTIPKACDLINWGIIPGESRWVENGRDQRSSFSPERWIIDLIDTEPGLSKTRVRDQNVEAELRCVPSQVVYSAGTVVCDRTGADDKLLAEDGKQDDIPCVLRCGSSNNFG